MLKVKFKKLREAAEIPKLATNGSVGFDLCAFWDKELLGYSSTLPISRGETVKIGTGIAIGEVFDEFGSPYYSYGAFVFARGGIATKQGLAPANKVGVIDMDYRGEIIVALHNHSDHTQVYRGRFVR